MKNNIKNSVEEYFIHQNSLSTIKSYFKSDLNVYFPMIILNKNYIKQNQNKYNFDSKEYMNFYIIYKSGNLE